MEAPVASKPWGLRFDWPLAQVVGLEIVRAWEQIKDDPARSEDWAGSTFHVLCNTLKAAKMERLRGNKVPIEELDQADLKILIAALSRVGQQSDEQGPRARRKLAKLQAKLNLSVVDMVGMAE